jgi:hypothetical protein
MKVTICFDPVECRNLKQVENAVMQALRLAHINDLEKQGNEMSLVIQTRYRELPDYIKSYIINFLLCLKIISK